MNNLKPSDIYNHLPVGTSVVDNNLNQYQIINKRERTNVIMGYFAGSEIQSIKIIEMIDHRGERINIYSHDIENPRRGDYSGVYYPPSLSWDRLLFTNKVEYDNQLRKDYKDYLTNCLVNNHISKKKYNKLLAESY